MDTPDHDFVFPLDSEMWKINHQKCGLWFGPAAAILQIAHPRIAQGVADHSHFQSDSIGRLRRTLKATDSIAFGTRTAALQTQQRIVDVHKTVKGKTSDGMSGPKGYSAFEPDLLMWVIATMIEAATQGYELVYGPLPCDRLERYYRDMRDFGTYFGLSTDVGPQSYADFRRYYDDLMASDLLGSHPLCAELAGAIASPNDSIFAKQLGRAIHFLPVETIPSPVREKLGFRSTVVTRATMKAFRQTVPTWFPLLPRRIRWSTFARERYEIERAIATAPLRPRPQSHVQPIPHQGEQAEACLDV